VLAEGFDPQRPGTPGSGITSRLYHSVVFDPVNERLVVYGGMYRTESPELIWVQADDVLAFDPVTRDWIILLEASKVQPPPP
jgi:hypothetical protein